MESRGSLRQLHQQLGDLSLAGQGFSSLSSSSRASSSSSSRGSALGWNAPDKRAPPPLPSLPPWTSSVSHALSPITDSRDEGTNQLAMPLPLPPPSGWKKPRPHFVSLKKLPSKVSSTEDRQHYQENDCAKEADFGGFENQHDEPEQTSPCDPNPSQQSRNKASLSESKTSGAGGGVTVDDTDHSNTNQQDDMPPEHRSPIRGQFFRPWKKSGSSEDDVQGDGGSNNDNIGCWSPPGTNKWKERALLNPFAKRRPAVKAPPSTLRPTAQLETQQKGVQSAPPFPVAERQPLNPVRVLSAAKRRAVTPQRPKTLLAPPLTPPLLPAQPSRIIRSPLDADKGLSHSGAASTDSMISQDSPSQIVAPPSRQLKPRQPVGVKKNQPKRSTMEALNEIKRKREARRMQQAEEKRRVAKELREHGDDTGYKFRKLIQQYRDALPLHQHQQQQEQLPPLLTSSTTLPPPTPPESALVAAANTPKLSVFIRKRPLAKKELKAKGYDIISCLFAANRQTNATLRRELVCHEPKWRVDCSETLENHNFHFDGVFDERQENARVYEATVGPMVPYLVVEGTASRDTANLTVFAYGQTGSGKTYTMKSIYRQAAADLFAQLDDRPHGSNSVNVGVSFYEIYMNSVNDLLNARSRVQLMEDGDGAVQLPGLKELPARSADELLELVQRGEQARATSANAIHDDSSRSHALLRVTLYDERSGVMLARLSMVDLAGSERAGDTQSDKKSTRMEGAEINKSLLALKECIRALDRGATHIPFRQSKLTQLLRDSFLSGNSKTIMIATISPCSESSNHTLNTLRYADRLKEIGSTN